MKTSKIILALFSLVLITSTVDVKGNVKEDPIVIMDNSLVKEDPIVIMDNSLVKEDPIVIMD